MADETNLLGSGQPSAATETSGQASPMESQADEGPIDIDELPDTESETTGEAETTEAPEPAEPEPGEEEPELEASDPFAGYEEIEFDGKAYKVPAELKDGYLRQADYTRKTQEVSELRKAAEAAKAEADTHLATSQEVIEARSHLFNFDQQLAQFQQTDWAKYEAEDPVGAMSAWRQFQQLQQTRNNLASQIDQFQNQMSVQAEQATVDRLRETRAFAERNIPGWNEDLDKKIVGFANSELGITTDELRKAISPNLYKTIHLAWVGAQSLARQKSAKPAPVPVTPTVKVTAKTTAPVQKDPGEMNEAEFIAYREAQIARRKAR